MGITYEIITGDDGKAEAIKCLRCNMVSYHPKDVEHRYCGNCHVFHDDLRQYSKQMPPHTVDVAFRLSLRPLGDKGETIRMTMLKNREKMPPEKVTEFLLDIDGLKDKDKP